MTATLERPPAAAPSPDVAPASRLARWWGQWCIALRLARRDAWRAKGRSLLVLLLIAVPVAAVAGVDVYSRAAAQQRSDVGVALGALGTVADAQLVPFGAGPVRQGLLGTPINGSDGRGASAAEMAAALPAGSRVVPLGGLASSILVAGEWGILSTVAVQDVGDPLVAGTWRVRDGRLPATADEIALTPAAARRAHAGIGSTLVRQAPGTGPQGERRTFTVVGLADTSNLSVGADAVVARGALPVDAESADQIFLASVPGGLDWAGVRRLNAIGVAATSRAVVESPPTFCATRVLCLDDGPVPGASPIDGEVVVDPGQAAQMAAQVGVGLVVVVLQIALLAGPAFAVQLRRRQRELGLLGASGGDASTMRRSVLASGVVLGVAGAVLGVALGWAMVAALGAAYRIPVLTGLVSALDGVPALPPEVVAISAVGVLAAVVASVVPAVVAGRGDVVDSLRGRRALPPVRRGVPLLGVGLGAVGVALVAYGVARFDAVVIGIGLVVGELGLLVLMPALVSWLSRPAGRLPLAPRLAVRDAGRHRMRTTAAAVAVAAAAAAATGASALAMTTELERGGTGLAYPAGSRLVMITGEVDDAGVPARSSVPQIAPTLASIDRALPGSAVAVMTDLSPTGPTSGGIDCQPPEDPVPATPGETCGPRRTQSGGSFSSSTTVLLRDPATIGTLLGPLGPADEARAALERGEVLALGYNAVDAKGVVTLLLTAYNDDGTSSTLHTVDLPALAVTTGAAPVQFVVGPAALAAGRPLHGLVEKGTSLAVVQPAQPDTGDGPTAVDRLALQFARDGLGNLGYVDPTLGGGEEALVLAAATGVTALVALLVGLMVTALALVDGRGDSRTLASVGGTPGLRRRMAASSAGFVTVLGCTTGVVSGLVAAWVLTPLFLRGSDNGHLFVVPWGVMAALVVVVPLLTAGAAFLTTRGRVPLVRRTD
ncbi:MAG: ABC transporter permease [Candidatus Nanopelagicales bacterium]